MNAIWGLMDPMGCGRNIGLAKRSGGSCDSPKSLGECHDSFLETREVKMTTPGFIQPSWGFEEVAKLMQLSTVPTKALENRMTDCIPYRGYISGSMPQLHHLLRCVSFIFVVLA